MNAASKRARRRRRYGGNSSGSGWILVLIAAGVVVAIVLVFAVFPTRPAPPRPLAVGDPPPSVERPPAPIPPPPPPPAPKRKLAPAPAPNVTKPAPPTSPAPGTGGAIAKIPLAHEAVSAGGGTLIPGADLLAGEGVSTPTQEGRASVVFPDGTLFKLDGLTTVTSIKASPSKRARLEKGLLIVSVPRQPAGKPAVITTPHAEVEIQGATLTFHVAPDSTRLEVVDGNVRLTRITDRKSVVVGAGKRAVVAPGRPLVEE